MSPKLPTIINEFTGPWKFLSNFYPCHVEFEGLVYPSVEHAYHAAKSNDPTIRATFTDVTLSPGDAKHRGRKLLIQPQDWDARKLAVMEQLLRAKFRRGSILWRKLLSTMTAELVEGNWWRDTYWGRYRGEGENHLGKLLMKLRTEAITVDAGAAEAGDAGQA